MSQTIHPLDIAVDEFDTAHRALVRAFLATGNTIDDAERLALDVVEQAHRMVREYRLRQVAGDSFTRNGDSRVTRDRFADAGFGVIDFERERAKHATNVIALFPNNRTAS